MRKLKEETELFYSYLKQNGLKKTYQKDLILETFLNTEGHLSVEDIYALVKKRDRKVGVVTVFRTLKSLTACGIAREITLGDGLTRFEHNYRHPQHHHIICTECHRAIEFVCPDLERIQGEIIKKYHFQPILNRFQTYGICEECLKQSTGDEICKYDTDLIFARDVVKMALAIETRFLEFFREAVNRNRNEEGNAIFLLMIQVEEAHIAELNAKLAAIIDQDKGLENAPIFLHFNLSELQPIIPDLSRFEMDGEVRLDAKAALSLIISVTRASAEFLKTYAENFSETQGKQILLVFAGQEESHGEYVRQHLQEQIPAVPSI